MIHTAQALRLVRRAQLDFLMNWTLDLAEKSNAGPRRLFDLTAPQEEDEKRDWRHLYDGSVLDD